MRKAILVLGPPRSGTSVVAHVISKLGVDFGDPARFVDSSVYKFNPIFFELQSLNRLNDQIFDRFSRIFGDFDWMPQEESFDEILVSNFENNILSFIEQEFSNCPVIGLKDPRFCFTLPIWHKVLSRSSFDIKYVLTKRNSEAVFLSNKAVTAKSDATNFRLVAQSTLLAQEFTRDKNVVEIIYEDLLADPLSKTAELCRALDLSEAHLFDACGVVNKDLNHQKEKLLLENKYKYFSNCIDASSFTDDDIVFYREIFWAARNDQCVEIRNLKHIVEEKNKEIAGLNQALVDSRSQVAELSMKSKGLSCELRALRNSMSWQLTLPLRKIADFVLALLSLFTLAGRQAFFQKAGQILHVVSNILNTAKNYLNSQGGLLPSISSLHKIIKNQGWNGFLSRVSNFFTAAGRFDYSEWIGLYDTLTEHRRREIKRRISLMSDKPLVSIVMPTYNSNTEWLKQSIDTVRNQLYTNWELCIADDASTDPLIRSHLLDVSKEDGRIKVVFREHNGHISAASNSALQLASGTWVALLDHDDMLAEHALYYVVKAINENPGVKLIYSDEDKIDAAGNRSDPYFKTDWNPELFYSQNMFSHLGVYQRDLLNAVGGFRKGLEGAQDYDLALRCIELVKNKQIHHIPKVLYHWRVHEESTARSSEAKPYAMLAGERALNEHFSRTGNDARAELIGFGYRIHYGLPSTLPLVSLIIPTKNNFVLLWRCIESIFDKTSYDNFEILIVDNGSDEPHTLSYLDQVSRRDSVKVLRDQRPFNFSALNNSAVDQAKGEVVAFLNDDTEVISSNWLGEMVSHVLRPGIGAVGAKLLYPDKTVQHAGIVCGLGSHQVAGHAYYRVDSENHGYFGRLSLVSSYSAVTGACLIVRKSIYQEVGGFDERKLGVAFNDVDFCLKLVERGYRNVFTPFAELYHHESVSRGKDDDGEKSQRFLKEVEYMKRRWGDRLLNDPNYSPNLSLDYSDFGFAWPPRLPDLLD